MITKANLIAALILSWPAYLSVMLGWDFICEVRGELRKMHKEKKDADTRPNCEDDQRPE